MPKMLRHVKTGEIWPMNPNMARHPDVEVFDKPDAQFAAAIAADDGATLGDVLAGADEPVVTAEHEFEDVPDFVPPVEEVAVEEVDVVDEVQAQKDAVAEKKAAIIAEKAAEQAEREAEAAEEELEEDDLDDLDMDLDDLDG